MKAHAHKHTQTQNIHTHIQKHKHIQTKTQTWLQTHKNKHTHSPRILCLSAAPLMRLWPQKRTSAWMGFKSRFPRFCSFSPSFTEHVYVSLLYFSALALLELGALFPSTPHSCSSSLFLLLQINPIHHPSESSLLPAAGMKERGKKKLREKSYFRNWNLRTNSCAGRDADSYVFVFHAWDGFLDPARDAFDVKSWPD